MLIGNIKIFFVDNLFVFVCVCAIPAMWFLSGSDTNRAVQAQKMARGWKFREKRDCIILVVKTKAQIRFAVSAKLICAFVFTYAKGWFSHDVAKTIIQRFFALHLRSTATVISGRLITLANYFL